MQQPARDFVPDAVTLLPGLRSLHLERKARSRSLTLYWAPRPDIDPTLVNSSNVRKFRLVEFLKIMHRPPRVVEIPEPLYLRQWLPAWAVASSLRLAGILRRQRITVVSYAIENLDADSALDLQRIGIRSKLLNGLIRRAWAASAGVIDRIAFGTPAAAANYECRLRVKFREQRVIEEVPAPCTCNISGPGAGPVNNVLFLGEFSHRKGIPQLLQAWPFVSAEVPQARLTLVGFGPLRPMVLAAAERDGHIVVHSPPRRAIHAILSQADVLVLPSQPIPGWKEQVGLPIVEGLSHGCRIVATTETGLAPWLEQNGHKVCASGSVASLAASIIEVLRHGPSSDQVRGALPAVDGRIAAEHWLHS